MRLKLWVLAVSLAACSPPSPQQLCAQQCTDCCTAEGQCVVCGGSGGGAAGGSAGGAAGGSAGGSSGGAQAGGGATGGGTAGGSAGGVAGGGAAGGTAGGGSAGGSAVCTNGGGCRLADAGFGVCCGSVCRDTTNDLLNCSGCGVQCPAGSSCSGSRCTVSCDGGVCPAGTQCTTSQYSNLACYPTSCAGVPENQFCARGDPISGRCCSGSCLETLHDRNNCGYCGRRCSATEDCMSGSCVTHVDCSTARANTTCLRTDGGSGQCCGGQCAQLSTPTDPNNCGGCGLQCPVGYSCKQGNCYAGDGGFGLPCVGSTTSQCPPMSSCDVTGYKCVIDACSPSTFGQPCGGGGTHVCCNSGCVDVYTDPNNCSTCGHACGAGQFCDNGFCRATPTCGLPNSGVDCPLSAGGVGKCCNGACVDLKTDSQNCYLCGGACPSGETCQANYCRKPDAGVLSACGGLCPAGTACDGNRCLPLACAPGASGGACAFGMYVGSTYGFVTGRCCNGACVDLTQDPGNCSMCGTACSSGLCVSTNAAGTTGLAACYGPVDSSCGMSCPQDMFCASGRCSPKTCGMFLGTFCLASGNQTGICCTTFSSSTCVNPSNDPANCGGCGVTCPAGSTCSNGVCSGVPPPCSGSGHLGQFCDADAGPSRMCCTNGGCVDTKIDGRNCGRCGYACASGLSCLNGTCVALSCGGIPQSTPCLNDAGVSGACCSGTCAQRGIDPLNCGSCGRICAVGETCAGGECAIDACDLSTQGATCHRDAGSFIDTGLCCSGACLDTSRDRNNCGFCGRVCPGDAGCVSGMCR